MAAARHGGVGSPTRLCSPPMQTSLRLSGVLLHRAILPATTSSGPGDRGPRVGSRVRCPPLERSSGTRPRAVDEIVGQLYAFTERRCAGTAATGDDAHARSDGGRLAPTGLKKQIRWFVHSASSSANERRHGASRALPSTATDRRSLGPLATAESCSPSPWTSCAPSGSGPPDDAGAALHPSGASRPLASGPASWSRSSGHLSAVTLSVWIRAARRRRWARRRRGLRLAAGVLEIARCAASAVEIRRCAGVPGGSRPDQALPPGGAGARGLGLGEFRRGDLTIVARPAYYTDRVRAVFDAAGPPTAPHLRRRTL